MARTLYLELTVDGETVAGTPVTPPPGREDDIECSFFSSAVARSLAAGSTAATGRRKYNPIIIHKAIDRTTPRLTQALVENKTVTAIFRFYRPDADGNLENYFTIELHEAWIASVSHTNPDASNAATRDLPETEEVSFVFQRITWRFEDGGIEYEDEVPRVH
jgi:type VI secretion system secreted protein Hcp